MKAIILAAGRGSRLDKYTADLPKGMLSFAGKSLIERQIETLKRNGIVDISIVTGYCAEKICFPGIKLYHNPEWADTNMLVSLMKAEDELNDDIIVAYSDILYSDELLHKMIAAQGHYCVAVDPAWREYWLMRYDRIDFDLESLKIQDGNRIVSLGKETLNPDDCDARYVGLLKFSKNGASFISKLLKRVLTEYADRPWQASGKVGRKAYMTDLIQELIDRKLPVTAVLNDHGWLEFDTNEDYERMLSAYKTGRLAMVFVVL